MNKQILVAIASAALLVGGSLQAAEGIKDRALDIKDGALDAAHNTKNAIIDGGAAVKDKVLGKPRHATSTHTTKRSLRSREGESQD